MKALNRRVLVTSAVLLASVLAGACSSSSDASTSSAGSWTKITTFAPLVGGNSAHVGDLFAYAPE